tara:strand:+ start:996 stop:1709 length:714 start_codon:yes stop_codon:yes gene_type:complete
MSVLHNTQASGTAEVAVQNNPENVLQNKQKISIRRPSLYGPRGGCAPPQGGYSPWGAYVPSQPPPQILPYTEEDLEMMKDIEDRMIEDHMSREEKETREMMNLNDLEIISAGDRVARAILISPDTGMLKDMDEFELSCNRTENYHNLISSSPEVEARESSCSLDTCGVLDKNNRVYTHVTILNKGNRYDNGDSKYGKVFIDKKFTKYLPEIGETVGMIIGLKGCGKTLPWVCMRVIM